MHPWPSDLLISFNVLWPIQN